MNADEMMKSMSQKELKSMMCQLMDEGREYNYGMNDATVLATRGKGFWVHDNVRDEVFVYNTWKEANGKARMTVAFAKSW